VTKLAASVGEAEVGKLRRDDLSHHLQVKRLGSRNALA
jgi:hypothetical protein